MHTTPQNSVITGVAVGASIGASDAIVFKGFTKGVMILQADASSPTTTASPTLTSKTPTTKKYLSILAVKSADLIHVMILSLIL